MKIPHPIPYQGSKRNLAARILPFFPAGIRTLIEPFAGSAAITLAAAERQLAERYLINDCNEPLARLWREIVLRPEKLAREYRLLWEQQHGDPITWFNQVRSEFNRDPRPARFLFLLTRCVKASVRYNARGEFNQSADKRRRGTHPVTMREQIIGASYLLQNRFACEALDYREVLRQAGPRDLVYMDPPYQGVCGRRDSRYARGISHEAFVDELRQLNHRGIAYIVSYDGSTGGKTYGQEMPAGLGLRKESLAAGRSSQATLLGRADETVESLYLSPVLLDQLKQRPFSGVSRREEQTALLLETHAGGR